MLGQEARRLDHVGMERERTRERTGTRKRAHTDQCESQRERDRKSGAKSGEDPPACVTEPLSQGATPECQMHTPTAGLDPWVQGAASNQVPRKPDFAYFRDQTRSYILKVVWP